MTGESPEQRLREAQAERDKARRTLERKTASLESLSQARQRVLAIVDRLTEDEGSDAEEKLVAILRQDAKDIGARADEAREAQEKQQTIADRRAALIERLRRRLKRDNVAMFDSVTVSEIPRDGQAAAGYTSGLFHTWPEIKAGPWPRKLSIAVTASEDAECLDVEPGDATPEEAPAWVRRQKARGVKRPVLYASLSNMSAVLAALARAGIDRSEVKVWTAHYTGNAHVCTPACGFGFQATADATQWTDHSMGRNLDESLCDGSFFAGQ
jgi:hypothetical protein